MNDKNCRRAGCFKCGNLLIERIICADCSVTGVTGPTGATEQVT